MLQRVASQLFDELPISDDLRVCRIYEDTLDTNSISNVIFEIVPGLSICNFSEFGTPYLLPLRSFLITTSRRLPPFVIPRHYLMPRLLSWYVDEPHHHDGFSFTNGNLSSRPGNFL